MTVKELIQKLSLYEDDLEVYVSVVNIVQHADMVYLYEDENTNSVSIVIE